MLMKRQHPGGLDRGVADQGSGIVGRTSIDLDPTAPIIPFASPSIKLLWGWPDLLSATGLPRRTLEKEISAGRFPKPVRYVGRRPFWLPRIVAQWAEGGGQ